MQSTQSEFIISTAELLAVTDSEISELLTRVYVKAGFTTPSESVTLFEPSAVRRRGLLIAARENQKAHLAGMVILVSSDSPASRLAGPNEAELQLLGVKPECRRLGIGRMLVETAINQAILLGYSKLILWTQHSMNSAQKLYESLGFIYFDDIERNGRNFKVYERPLCI